MALTVRDIMANDLVTVGPSETARSAYKLMRDRRIRHLPVMTGGRLVGVLSDRDLRPVLLSPGDILSFGKIDVMLCPTEAVWGALRSPSAAT